MIAPWIGVLSFFIWVYLLAGRGGFWRLSKAATELTLPLTSAPRIAVVVPARDEAEVISLAIRSLLEQDYPGRVQIFVVDDHSSDETASVAHRAAGDKAEQVTMSSATPLPAGWTGKMWALSEGVRQAAQFAPDYFLFTDADIVHASDSIASLVARAQADKLDLVSIMARLRCSSLAERALIPPFVFFFHALSAGVGQQSYTQDCGCCGRLHPGSRRSAGEDRRSGRDPQRIDRRLRFGEGNEMQRRGVAGSSAEHVQHSRLQRLRRSWPHDLAHRVLPVTAFGLAAARNNSWNDDCIFGAAGFGLLRRMGRAVGRCRLAADERRILADSSVLLAVAAVGASAACHCAVLYGRNGPFGGSILAGSRWRVERPLAGCKDPRGWVGSALPCAHLSSSV
jgi:glycosyltransferase involved in cell wall biosynthesis